MPEAITKYAINSTLGTEDFQPLDQIIKGQRTLVASDATYGVIDVELSNKFYSNVDGSVRIIIKGRAYGNSTHRFNIISNVRGNLATIESKDGTAAAYNSFNKSKDINIVKGETISFSKTSSVFPESVTIGASVVDGSLGKVIIG